ncbi:MAG TPA: radical SAM protein [Desulfurivibrio alkaliphilus]|uniref:Radical SAM protein n=1 Tax=Desulfurivibrio alkaliphilus TaxID=427923 RepID=A0A7C2XNC9_9BACT|nr:radical SAM protein [Desulfurivibrio alkaliphilus]
MNRNLNSRRPRTLYFQPGERNIFLHLLTACNLSCRHCYINPAQHGSGTLARSTLEEWLTLFADPGKKSNVIFLGGEPTLHPDLVHGVRYAQQLGYQGITIDTNGFLHHDLLARLRPEEAVLSFSLDGPDPAINDPLRGAGVFATATANLKQAVAKGFDVSLIFTASRLNIEHLPRMPALLAELGCRRFFIQVIGLRGKSAADPASTADDPLQLTPDQWLEVVPKVAAEAAARGIQVIYPKVYLEPDEPFQCAGRLGGNFFIFPNGRVYLCPLCEDFPLNALRLENGELRENPGITERKLFNLDIPEGCVMNKLLQPGNIAYNPDGTPRHRISCCLLKQEIG